MRHLIDRSCPPLSVHLLQLLLLFSSYTGRERQTGKGSVEKRSATVISLTPIPFTFLIQEMGEECLAYQEPEFGTPPQANNVSILLHAWPMLNFCHQWMAISVVLFCHNLTISICKFLYCDIFSSFFIFH